MRELIFGEPIICLVDHFDENSGMGKINIFGNEIWFHCVSIADGSKTINNNKQIVVTLRMARNGLIEALQVTKCD